MSNRQGCCSRLNQFVSCVGTNLHTGESGNVLDSMQPTPVPFLVIALQHDTTLGELQDEVPVEGLGRADVAMARERTLRMVLNCILVVKEGLRLEVWSFVMVEKFPFGLKSLFG